MAADAIFAALGRIQNDPNEEIGLDALAPPLTIWNSAVGLCRSFPNANFPPLIPETSDYFKLYPHQKIAILKALAYISAPNDPRNVVSIPAGVYTENTKERTFKEKNPLSLRSKRFNEHNCAPIKQCMRLPCGSGKTAILLHVAALAAHNVLIITNNRDNSIQVVQAILNQTNLSTYAEVKLIRSNANEDHSVDSFREEEEAAGIDTSFVQNTATSVGHGHVLPGGGGLGIAVVDKHTIKWMPNASQDRLALREQIFKSQWGAVIIDEADAVSDQNFRLSFVCGASTRNGREVLKYDSLFVVSGTFYRYDEVGDVFLRSLGPTTYSLTSRHLEDQNHLARLRVCLVQCDESQPWVREASTKYGFQRLAPAKLRVCERLVRFHAAHGHKIMIFTWHRWELSVLERLFSQALAPSGKTPNDAFKNILKAFKEPVELNVDHKLLWITTTKGEVGLDVPDTCVVINLTGTDSPRVLMQRFGRAGRKKGKNLEGETYESVFSWVYDLVGPCESEPWTNQLAGKDKLVFNDLAAQSNKYKLLFGNGYTDAFRYTSDELITNLDAYVAEMKKRELQPEYCEVLENAEALLNSCAFDDHEVVLDHVLTCVWGSFLIGRNGKEELRCDCTFFDTPSRLALEDKNTKKNQIKEVKRAAKSKASFQQKLSIRLPRKGKNGFRISKASSSTAVAGVAAGVAADATDATDIYMSRPVDSHIIKRSEIRKAIAAIFEGAGEEPPDPANPVDVWKSLMSLRKRANDTQRQAEKARVETVRATLLLLGKLSNRACEWLSDGSA